MTGLVVFSAYDRDFRRIMYGEYNPAEYLTNALAMLVYTLRIARGFALPVWDLAVEIGNYRMVVLVGRGDSVEWSAFEDLGIPYSDAFVRHVDRLDPLTATVPLVRS